MQNALDLLRPKDAAARLGISVATITRCVKLGAPVHRWGSTGHRYRIEPEEFVAWMEVQGTEKRARPRAQSPAATVDEMAARNRARFRAL
jgi:hypothetical protein